MAETPPSPTRAVNRELDILGSLRAHWRASCGIFLAAAALFLALAVSQSQRTYTSTAALHVARTFPRTLQDDSELDLNSSYDYDAFRNDQVALILRPDVLNDALRRCGQDGPPWAPAGAQANVLAENFARALTVYAVPKSSRIEIALKSSQPETLQPALTALLAAFQDAHRREYFFTQDERPETLRTALAAVETDIAAKRKEIEDLTKQLGVTSFGAATVSPWSASLEQSRLALASFKQDVISAEARRETLRAAIAAPLPAADLLAGATDWLEPDSGLMELLTPLAGRHAQLKAELAGLSEGHPGRAATLRQLAEIEEQVSQIRKRQLEAQLREADSDVLQAEAGASLMQKELESLAAANGDFLASFQRGRILEDDLPRTLSLRDRLNQRLEFFEFEAQSPSFAEVTQPASEVDLRGESPLRRNLILAILLAIMLALGSPILWDLLDRRVHTPGDLNRVLGFAAAGWLPGAGGAAPFGLHASQVQRIAQALDRDRKRSGARLLVFSGVTSLPVLDLLRELALALQGLGRRVLVVDAAGGAADGGAAGPGLVGLLAGGAMKCASLEGGVRFLPYGDAEQSAPRWDAWSQTLAAAAKDFDLVLVAAPALLSAPDAELLVTDADLAVLVVAAEDQSLGEVGRAGQLLRALRPKAMGALLTNVKPAHCLAESLDQPGASLA